MTDEERRTLTITALVLLVASLGRIAWESRPIAPILPPEVVSAEHLEATRAAVAREERMATPLGPGERIDPNRGSDVELARLPGLGPALAARIVEDRDARGPYLRAADLLRVSGIGDATLARIEPHLDLSEPPRIAVGSAERERLDLNQASEADLQALPGIGPALAGRIIEHRGRLGRFGAVDDLEEVSGIGPATLERLRPLVRTGP